MMKIPTVGYRQTQLPNGLKVILHSRRTVPLVHLTVHYNVGSSYEKPGQSGFAHLFEHLMFQGSEHVGKNEHGFHVDSAGGRWNATTSKDRTNYYETLPSESLELGLWLESDRMRSLRLTEENFENQRQTVIEEKKQSYDNQPYGLADLRFDELAYSNWAYAHPIIGSVQDLQAASLEDAKAFHSRYYRPDNATLVLAGDFDEKDALQRIGSYFGWSEKSSQYSHPDLSEPPQGAGRMEILQDPLAPLPAIYLGYHMPGYGTPDHYALSILAVILSNGESSRLYKRLVYDNNWITTLSCGPNHYRGPQIFTFWCQVQSDVKPRKVLAEVRSQLLRLKEKKISKRELEKARNQLAFRFVSTRSTVASTAEMLAKYSVLYGDTALINTDAENYFAVKPENVLETAQRVFREENETLILVEPVSRAAEGRE